MAQQQYDMQAHSEQIRHELLALDDAFEDAMSEAINGASGELADLPGCEILDMCANDDYLDKLLVELMDSIAGMSASGFGEVGKEQDRCVLASARKLRNELLGIIGDRRAKAVTWGAK